MPLSKGAKIGLAVGAVALVLLVSVASSYNGLVAARTGVDTQANQIGVAYARKLDLLPALTNITREYMQNEADVQTKVAALRSGSCANPSTVEAQDACNAQVNEAFAAINVAVERYPDLKASELYKGLQTEMVNSQNKISAEQNLYNDAVGSYNARIQSFPTNLVAGLFGFSAKPFIGTRGTGGSNAGLGTNNLG